MSNPCSHSDFLLSGYTFETLPAEYLYSWHQSGQTFCEDVRALYKYIQTYDYNPYTREPLGREIIDDIRRRFFSCAKSVKRDDDSAKPVKRDAGQLGRFANLIKFAAPYQIERVTREMKLYGLLPPTHPAGRSALMAFFDKHLASFSTRQIALLHHIFAGILEPKTMRHDDLETMPPTELLDGVWDLFQRGSPTIRRRFVRELTRQGLVEVPHDDSVESWTDAISLQQDGRAVRKIVALARWQFATPRDLEPLWDLIIEATDAKLSNFADKCVAAGLIVVETHGDGHEFAIKLSDAIGGKSSETDLARIIDLAYEHLP